MGDWANWVHAGKITSMESLESKSEIRQRCLAARPQSSEGLAANLVRLTLELNANVVSSYQPLANEPDVAEFNSWVIAMGKTLLLPRIFGDELVFASGDLEPGSHGILEPQGDAQEISERSIDESSLFALIFIHLTRLRLARAHSSPSVTGGEP